MPVRLTDNEDEQREDSGNDNNRGGGGSGGGSGIAGVIIGFVLGLLVRNPKVGIPIIILLIVLYMCTGGGGSSVGGSADGADPNKGLGCQLNRNEFDKAQVFEPLADGQLPSKVSLQQYAPKAGDQGRQGSCTAWATAYAARTIQESATRGVNPDQIAFSPAYLYNQITRGNCTGTSIRTALDIVRQQGLATLQQFPYNDEDCSRQPGATQRDEAQNFRIRGYNRLTKAGENYSVDIVAVKQNLAQGAPVVIGMLVGGSFYQLQGRSLWVPTARDYEKMKESQDAHIVNDAVDGFGGHAMCVIGYDDDYEGGAFHIQNSWGEQWGDKGTFWMRYRDFESFTNELGAEVYGLFPMKAAKKDVNAAFKASVGLVNYNTKQYMPVRYLQGNSFATMGTQAKGTRFKIEVSNSVECYAYVLGMDTDETSYVLFPYSSKYSAYCGITGKRVFPRGKDMQLDDVGSTDYMAVLLTKEEIDFAALNQRVNGIKGGSYAQRLQQALGQLAVKQARFSGGNTVQVEVAANDPAKAVLVVFEINKQ